MASSKLTLSIEPEFIEIAKNYASEHNISVSKLFKNYIKELSNKSSKNDPLLEKLKNIELSDDIKALSGVLKGKYPDDMTYKDMKYDYLKDKHGL